MGRGFRTCRVCTKKSKDFVELEAIFIRKPQITYLEVYNICTQLNAIIDDELPMSLCSLCGNELKSVFRFLEKAKETDKRLREKLGTHRSTRRSRRIKQEEGNNGKFTKISTPPDSPTSDNAEPDFEEVKSEFINCLKDPLEDSDLEANEKSEDEMDWIPDHADDIETDGFAEEKTATIEDLDDDDDDDKPLKQLIEKEKFKPASAEATKENLDNNPDYDSSDVFNDLPEPADNCSSEDDDDVFKDKMLEVVPGPPTTPEAQIFPQGRYMCKVCKKTYFTAEGLKAHMTVHMPKKKKVKRIRGPNKKKNKKKSKHASDEEDGEDDEAHKNDEKTEDSETKNVEEDDSNTPKPDESITAEPGVMDGKKKRKNKPPKPKKMFPCSVCGKHMISASKLRYHMVMHTGEKDFLCTMCPKAYSTIYALKHHMRTHTGERPYECNFCGDKFTRPTTLKSHMRRHTGERPYGCDICGKRFIQHSSMTTHMKLNHMAKTIGCPHCDKKYARQTDLNTHLLSHTGDKPFSCSLCPSRFIRQANLNKHMNQHHLAKNKSSNSHSTLQQLELKTDEAAAAMELTEQSAAQDAKNHPMESTTRQFVEESIERVTTGPTTIQFAGQSMNHKMHSSAILSGKNNETSASMVNQFAGQIMEQKISAGTKYASHIMQQKINASSTTNQFNPVQQQQQQQQDVSLPPLPKMVSVRSLARPPQKAPPTAVQRRGLETATPPGSDESNCSNRFLPPPPLSSPTASSQLRHQQSQQNNMMAPPAPQQRLRNNENSMPMSMNIAGIPGGIPTHSMLGGGGGVHIGQHGQMGSVEHLKGIHPPVDNLTNLLGQVIDPERIGRSVDDMMPWTWTNTS